MTKSNIEKSNLAKRATQKEIILILDNLRSVQNVASIFRTANTAGINKVFLIGSTPGPVDRFGRPRANFLKISLGAEKSFSLEYKNQTIPVLEELKRAGFKIIAIEQSTNSSDYRKVGRGKRTVFIVGNEKTGLSKPVLVKCDAIAEIKMRGGKESLNVSVALAVALFRILDI